MNNRMTSAPRFAVLSGLAISLLTACAAPVELKNPLLDDLSECETALQSCRTERQNCLVSLDRVSGDLDKRRLEQTQTRGDLEVARADLAACRADAARLETQTDELSRRRDELSKQLETSIAKKDVEISLLKGKLSVRVLDRVLFPSGSASIQPEGLIVLGKIAGVLASGEERIRVEGHTDNDSAEGRQRNRRVEVVLSAAD